MFELLSSFEFAMMLLRLWVIYLDPMLSAIAKENLLFVLSCLFQSYWIFLGVDISLFCAK